MVVTIGTGGHIFPALEVAKRLRALGVEVMCLVRKGIIEKTVMDQLPFPRLSIRAYGFAGKSLLSKIVSLWSLLGSVYRLNIFMKSNKINCLFGTGGYGMVPPILVCLWRRIPFYTLELNRRPGSVIKSFARYAKMNYLALPLDKPIKARTTVTGVPLREEFGRAVYNPASKVITFLGGSQGAHRLNEMAVHLTLTRPDLSLRIVCGSKDFADIRKKLTGKKVEVIGFTEKPWHLLSNTCLAISRSGSNSLYELLTVGVPMILVPFPYAILDHQLANARYAQEHGAAYVITEDRLTFELLSQHIDQLMLSPTLRRQMHEKARALVLRDSAGEIAQDMLRRQNAR